MNACDLRFPAYDAAAHLPAIRWTLFTHSEVLDVLPTLHRDTLRLLHHGQIAAAAWRATLAESGFPAPEVVAAPTAPAGRAAAGTLDGASRGSVEP